MDRHTSVMEVPMLDRLIIRKILNHTYLDLRIKRLTLMELKNKAIHQARLQQDRFFYIELAVAAEIQMVWIVIHL